MVIPGDTAQRVGINSYCGTGCIGLIEGVTYKGKGINPFGADDCNDLAPTATPTTTPTATPTATATETPIPTETPTPDICPPPGALALNAEGNGAAALDYPACIVPSSTPAETLIPTVTTTPIGSQLDDYGIVLEGEWLLDEQAEILEAAKETGAALSAHGADADPIIAFREVLQGTNGTQWRAIKFSRIDNSPGPAVCITAKMPDGIEYSANIQCDHRVTMNRFTAVHEFGHVFVGRTTQANGISSYSAMVEIPSSGGGSLRDLAPTPNFVMGPRSYNLERGPSDDWQRSNVLTDNGWGSAGLWNQGSYYTYDFPEPPAPTPTLFPLMVPQIGPCGEGAPSLPVANGPPFPFQQNPCTFPNWETTDPVGPITEVEEAAADMFLNWVYWKNYGSGTAFLDQIWRSSDCYPNGCPDSGLSGQARSTWMNGTMSTIFAQFGW